MDVTPRANADAVDQREQRKHGDGDDAVGDRQLHQIAEIAREGDRNRSHAAGLDHQQQRPAVKEGGHGPIGVAQIGILAADLRPPSGKLGINERRGQRDNAANDPHSDNEQRRIDVSSHFGGSDKNARADDPSHHQHRRVEQSETPREAV